MANINALKNRGIVAVGTPTSSTPKTIVVVGIARSGTSILAGALSKLGVFMGDAARPPVFEDVRLASAMESSSFDQVEEILSEYNERAAVWGFKRPGMLPFLERMHGLYCDPFYLFIFRDLLSIAKRNELSMKAAPLHSMRRALEGYATMLEFIENAAPNGLMISCEKLLVQTPDVLRQLIDTLRLSVTPAEHGAALRFICPDPPQYLDSSRLHFLGSLDKLTSSFASGWAYVKNHPAPAKLSIRLNGEAIGEAVATRPRSDVKEKGIHPTGHCGFRFEFPSDVSIHPGDEVSARFVIGDVELKNSPRTLVVDETAKSA